MGTRGSAGIIIKDEVKLAYNHFDSYPSGLGVDILMVISEINKENGWEQFKKNAEALKSIDVDEITDTEMIQKYKKYSNTKVGSQKLSEPYCLFRNIQGADWIYEVYRGNLNDYTLDNNFIRDSLFCEYAYVINLDTMKLEFYCGFQHKPQFGNRFGTSSVDGYYPSRLVGIFSLYEINNNTEILKKLEFISNSEQDDPSVLKYFRELKLNIINEMSL